MVFQSIAFRLLHLLAGIRAALVDQIRGCPEFMAGLRGDDGVRVVGRTCRGQGVEDMIVLRVHSPFVSLRHVSGPQGTFKGAESMASSAWTMLAAGRVWLSAKRSAGNPIRWTGRRRTEPPRCGQDSKSPGGVRSPAPAQWQKCRRGASGVPGSAYRVAMTTYLKYILFRPTAVRHSDVRLGRTAPISGLVA